MKAYVKMTIVILVAYILTFFSLAVVQTHSDYEKTSIEDQIEVYVQRTNGTMDFHPGVKFPVLNKGDVLTASISVPESIDYKAPVLCFGCFNCDLTLTFNDDVLYTYGQDLARDGKHIGSVYASVPLPDRAIGAELLLQAVSHEDHSTGALVDVSILPGAESHQWIMMDHLIESMFLIAILITSFMMTMVLILSDGRRRLVRVTLWLLSFMSLLATYKMASNGILYALIGNVRLCSDAEYVCFYAMPIPLLAFCGEFFDGKKTRMFSHIMLGIQLVFFIAVTILNYTTRNYHYCRFLHIQNILIAVSAIVAIIIAFKVIPHEDPSDITKCMCYGLAEFFVCIALDMARYYLVKFTPLTYKVLDFDFLFLGILLMSTAFILSVFYKVTQAYTEREKKNYFQHLAYTDILTGLGNRTRYYEHVKRIRSQQIKDYTVFFMDLNNLKEVNDRFGHECGDRYIKAAAKSVEDTFAGADAILRIGGDEFIVLYYDSNKQNSAFLFAKMKEQFEMLCAKEDFPFRGSVSCGEAVSTMESPIDIEVAVKHADAKMYEEKKKIKEMYGTHCRIMTQ